MKRTYFLYDDDGNILKKATVTTEDELQDAQVVIAEAMAEDFVYCEETYPE